MTNILYDPNSEVVGSIVLSYVENLQADEMLPLLKKHGFEDIQPDQWYSVKQLMGFYEDIAKLPNYETNMIAIGMKIAELAPPPPEVTLADVLAGWENHMYAAHRNGDIGHIKVEKVSDKHYRTIHTHIYPDGLCYGLAYGFAKSQLPKGTNFKVWYEDEEIRRDNGDSDTTVLHVSWE